MSLVITFLLFAMAIGSGVCCFCIFRKEGRTIANSGLAMLQALSVFLWNTGYAVLLNANMENRTSCYFAGGMMLLGLILFLGGAGLLLSAGIYGWLTGKKRREQMMARIEMSPDVFEAVPIPILLVNEEGQICLHNQAAADFFHASGKPILNDSVNRFFELEETALEECGTFGKIDAKCTVNDKFCRLQSSRREDAYGDFLGHLIVITDISDQAARIQSLETYGRRLKIKLAAIKKEAEHDELTGLYNRKTAQRKMTELLSKNGGVLYLIDIDRFKEINDNYGHAQGDKILKVIAACMRETAPAEAVVCRQGGDEFIIFMPGNFSGQQALRYAEEVRRHFRKYTETIRILRNSSFSIGISIAEHAGGDFQTMFEEADSALYYVKRTGKNNCHIYQRQEKDADKKQVPL